MCQAIASTGLVTRSPSRNDRRADTAILAVRYGEVERLNRTSGSVLHFGNKPHHELEALRDSKPEGIP